MLAWIFKTRKRGHFSKLVSQKLTKTTTLRAIIPAKIKLQMSNRPKVQVKRKWIHILDSNLLQSIILGVTMFKVGGIIQILKNITYLISTLCLVRSTRIYLSIKRKESVGFTICTHKRKVAALETIWVLARQSKFQLISKAYLIQAKSREFS